MDERIRGEYRKIYSELLSLILIFAACVLLIKVNVFGMGPKDCVTEFAVLVLSPVYLAVRRFMLGIDPDAAFPPKRRRLVFFVSLGAAAAGYLAVMAADKKLLDGSAWENLFLFAAVFTLVYAANRSLGKYFSGRKSREYED